MAKRQRHRRQERRRKHAEQHGWSTSRSVITGAGLTAGAVLGMGGVAHATDFTVTNLSDGAAPGPAGSLRKAITDANANPGADRILFDSSLSGRLNLTSGSLQILQGLEIQGPGADELTIDAYESNTRIFYINPATTGDPVTISGLTMAYGHTVTSGGAIVDIDAKLTVADSFFYGNYADFSGIGGGAIEESGGYMSGSQTTIRNTTITGNAAPNGSGGGIGAAMQNGNIVNSTIAGNYAYNFGGGVFANDNGAHFLDSTVAHNYSYNDGGGIVNGTGGTHTIINNSIVGDNTANGSGADLVATDPFDAEFSLIENATGVTVNSTVTGSNILGSDPRLSDYLDFSGPTPTLVPDYTSPVIDQGKAEGGVTTDQRGLARPFDLNDTDFPNSAAVGADGSDMGAVEDTVNETSPADLAFQITDSPDPVTVGSPLNYQLTVTNNGPNDATGVEIHDVVPTQLSVSTVSGNCIVGSTDPDYGTYVTCNLGNVANGAAKSGTISVVPQAAAASLPYVTNYAASYGDQVDPNTYDNFSYANTVVRGTSSAPPPAVTPPSSSGVAAAVKRCKKKFHGKRRKKCIKRAHGRAAASVQRNWRAEPTVHPWTKRQRPRGIDAPGTRSRLDRLTGG